MICNNVLLHNVDTPPAVEGGVLLQRAPEAVRREVNERAQGQLRLPAGVEVRYVSKGPATVRFRSEGQSWLWVFRGGYQADHPVLVGTEEIAFQPPHHPRLIDWPQPGFAGTSFSPDVVRLRAFGDPLIFCGAEGEGLRPPSAEEMPTRRYLAYGTSITQGVGAAGPHLTYAARCARLLDADLINLGCGGSALCDQAMTDYMAGRSDWDFATLEISVNMCNRGMAVEEFTRRAEYMVDRLSAAAPARPVVCMTMLPFFYDAPGVADLEPEGHQRAIDYRQALRDVAAGIDRPNIHLVEGPELLRDAQGLKDDLIHPGDVGMAEIAKNLADRLRPLL